MTKFVDENSVFENTAAEMQVIWHEVNSRVNDEVRFRASN